MNMPVVLSKSLVQWVGMASLTLLAACAERPIAERAAPVQDAKIQPIYVATGRELTETGPSFGRARADKVNYFRISVSVPPTHQPGQIEWPRGAPDAATDFVVTQSRLYTGLGPFARDVHAAGPGRETLMFVHGYNNTLPEAMYRLAQIQTDFETDMPAVLFSWPSAGDARGYAYDRDSILFARDDMERTLKALTNAPGEKVFLVAHSMGAHLAMEVLRQAAIRGDRQLLSRISGVVLMSPDIDPDIFRRQAQAIGKLPQPFMIFVAKQDKALNLIGFLTGRKQRLGVIDGPESVAGLDISVVDFSQLADGEGFNHFVPVTSPSAVKALQGLMQQAGQSASPLLTNFLVLRPQS